MSDENCESCDICKNELVACCCMEEDVVDEVTKLISLEMERRQNNVINEIIAQSIPLPENIKKYYHCSLLHSTVPRMTDKGIVWVCKEGCNENRIKRSVEDTSG